MMRIFRSLGLAVSMVVLLTGLLSNTQFPARTPSVLPPGSECLAADARLEETAQLFERLFNEVAEKVKPSVVHVKAVKIMKGEEFERFHPPFGGRDLPFGEEFDRGPRPRMPREFPKEFRQEGAGSGVIVDPKGFILTNNHVVEEADELYVTLSTEKKEYKAKVIGRDQPTDVAVIKIEAENLPVATLGDSDKIKTGDWAIAIGNPFGLNQTVTAGIISATGRSQMRIAEYEDFIQTDAAINPGNSGGPLLNLRGEVIGINTAIFTRTGGYQGIGFAIPINMAKAVMKSLMETGKVTRGWLGVAIQDITPDLAKSFNLAADQGALIGDVTPNSPAEKAGMQRGDVVVEFEGREIKDVNHLRNTVAQTPVGKVAKVKVLRDGKPVELSVTIGEQPADFLAKGGGPPQGATKNFGLTLGTLSPELAKRFGYEGDMGVVVVDVEPGSPAERAGIQAGNLIKEVNRERVHNLQEYQAVASKGPADKGVLLLVKSGNFTHYVLVQP
ncbi:MAG TPA: DegQ family serine endoprotease [Candidatus Tripitaka californicus]|uniref:DegQ family serine endoprotease n=1 Tax=Candidatus Tripitaka californicus TaxID=3367616 RepID=UPI0040250458